MLFFFFPASTVTRLHRPRCILLEDKQNNTSHHFHSGIISPALFVTVINRQTFCLHLSRRGGIVTVVGMCEAEASGWRVTALDWIRCIKVVSR